MILMAILKYISLNYLSKDTLKKGIIYKEPFFPISKKYSFIIIMTLVAYFDLELYQVDAKIAFLNGTLHEEVYMTNSRISKIYQETYDM